MRAGSSAGDRVFQPAAEILSQLTLAIQMDITLLAVGVVKLVFSEVVANWIAIELISASMPLNCCSSLAGIRYSDVVLYDWCINEGVELTPLPTSMILLREILTSPAGSK